MFISIQIKNNLQELMNALTINSTVYKLEKL